MQNKDIYFNFLEELRKSGITNMYGASAFLTGARYPEDYGYDFETKIEFLSNSEAAKILSEWMKNYSELSKRLGWDKTMTPSEDDANLEYSNLFDEEVSKETIDLFLKHLADEDLMDELNDAEHIWILDNLPIIVSYNDGSSKILSQTDKVTIYPSIIEWSEDFNVSPDHAVTEIKRQTGVDLPLPMGDDVAEFDDEEVFDYDPNTVEEDEEF